MHNEEDVMKRVIAVILVGIMLAGVASGCTNTASGEAVSVEPVSMIVSTGSVGLADRYAGMVVAGDTAKVKRDQDKTVLEINVEEGDLVKTGDLLFSYDTEAMQLDLDKTYLEREQLENTIAAAQQAIDELQKERDKAKEGDKLRYTLEIDAKNVEIREANYNISLKDRDIATKEAALENAEVYAPISGRVMSVDEDGTSNNYYDPGSGDGVGTGVDFITITDVTRLRIQGNISEMNASALSEGMPMVVRSRIDNTVTWSGTLSMIDWENPVQGNNNNGGVVYVDNGSGDDGMTSASKYPFYIELDSTDGLILGQHVYIEPGTGEEEDEKPEGPMLPEYYIQYEEDGSAYVWAADGNKLEKRAVTLGVYDEMAGTYEIAEGLDLSDYIAFPEEGLEEGRPVTRYEQDNGEDVEDPAAVGVIG